jgi:uncharacterized phage infection (PIP) family protein YhgE
MTIIQLKYGAGIPANGKLKVGELGIDISAKTIYTSTDGTDIVELAGGDISWGQIDVDTYPSWLINLIPNVDNDDYVDLKGLEYRVDQAEEDIDALEAVVGDVSTGLVKDVNDLKAQLSALEDSINDPANGFQAQIDALKETDVKHNNRITALETAVGQADPDGSGLIKDVDDNKQAIEDLKDAVDKDLTGLVFGGSYDAAQNEITSTSTSGQDAGLRVQGKLNEYLDPKYEGLYVIVDKEGELEDTVRDGYDGKTAHVGDWMVSDGVHGWILMEFGNEHVTWGTIGGDIDNQSDLKAALESKLGKGETIDCGSYN